MSRYLGNVVIYSTFYTVEDDGQGGSVPRYADEPSTEVYENVTASDAVAIIKSAGLTFAASGCWSARSAADPDGSYTSNYSTGEQCERTAVLEGFPNRLSVAIANTVG
jgi:hypothetical protein